MMKNIPLCLILLLFVLPTRLAGQKNATYEAYVEQYKDLAVQQMLKYRIPASITMAQAILESGAGRSDLAVKGNNHFGIKCHGWTGRTMHHDDDASEECFRAYSDAQQSFEDHSRFLVNGQRYKGLFSLSIMDYRGWAKGLKQAGYATNPAYPELLIRLIETYNLSQLDGETSYDKYMASKASKNRSADGQPLHPIRLYNNNYYLIARSGDTFDSIGREVGISGRKIAKRNERPFDDPLSEGDIVYLKKKQKQAMDTFEGVPHTVKAGQSMYLIAQMYGVRLKNLYKMNGLKPDYQIQAGDRLRVR